MQQMLTRPSPSTGSGPIRRRSTPEKSHQPWPSPTGCGPAGMLSPAELSPYEGAPKPEDLRSWSPEIFAESSPPFRIEISASAARTVSSPQATSATDELSSEAAAVAAAAQQQLQVARS